jgi:sugar phosphate isomerase/epimerase
MLERTSQGLMTRRALLRCTSAAAAVLAGAGRLPVDGGAVVDAPRVPARVLRLSTSSLLFKEFPIDTACERIAALGFEAIDLWSAYEGCPHLDDALERLGGSGLRELLARHRLQLFAASTYVGGYEKYARLLGAAGGCVAVQGSAGPCTPNELTARMRAFLEAQKPLADLAGEQQSWLAIENHGQSLLDGLDSFKAFVDLNTHPRLGLALAPYHLQAGGVSVPETIRVAGRQLRFFYAWQHATGIEQLPGQGPADFRPWLEALRATGYGGCLNVFIHGHPEAARTTDSLRQAKESLARLMSSDP